MRIPKLEDAENYQPWAISVQAALESRNVCEIVTGTKVALPLPEASASKNLQDDYELYFQRQAFAKGILILSIDLSIEIRVTAKKPVLHLTLLQP